jgi:hypothetical protein
MQTPKIPTKLYKRQKIEKSILFESLWRDLLRALDHFAPFIILLYLQFQEFTHYLNYL